MTTLWENKLSESHRNKYGQTCTHTGVQIERHRDRQTEKQEEMNRERHRETVRGKKRRKRRCGFFCNLANKTCLKIRVQS